MKKVLLTLLLLSIYLTSCDYHKQDTSMNTTLDTFPMATLDTNLVLDFVDRNSVFHKPSGGDYFTYDTTNLLENKFILVSDFGDSAVICIKGKNIFLTIDTSQTIVRQKDNTWKQIWKNDNYKAILQGVVFEDKEEGIYSNGTLEILSIKSKRKFNVKGVSEE